jgi:A/G-specific adenine glycosylase
MKLDQKEIKQFQKTVWNYYKASARHNLPWRTKINPYRIWISEVMLQQTQVDRVVNFFNTWMKSFPTIAKLAQASQVELLKHWKGLGYNSRAIRLKQTAQIIVNNNKGIFPSDYQQLQKLPGIGPYTAGAILAFAYNQPITIIETNIRRVFIHHFFSDRNDVGDDEILQLVEKTIDIKNPKEWYWALMDYGSFLGRTLNIKGKKYNPNVQSKHYTKQSKFAGSDRQIRGKILEIILQNNGTVSEQKLFNEIKILSTDKKRLQAVVSQMAKEGFLQIKGKKLLLKK